MSIASCRALEFIFIFLDNVLKGEQDLVKCAHAAYDNSLRKYHGWIVRGVFSVRSSGERERISNKVLDLFFRLL